MAARPSAALRTAEAALAIRRNFGDLSQRMTAPNHSGATWDVHGRPDSSENVSHGRPGRVPHRRGDRDRVPRTPGVSRRQRRLSPSRGRPWREPVVTDWWAPGPSFRWWRAV